MGSASAEERQGGKTREAEEQGGEAPAVRSDHTSVVPFGGALPDRYAAEMAVRDFDRDDGLLPLVSLSAVPCLLGLVRTC